MKYRIRKNKQERYIPEMKGFITLFMWWIVPDISGIYSSARNLGRYNQENAEKVISYYKEYEKRKEEIIRIDEK